MRTATGPELTVLHDRVDHEITVDIRGFIVTEIYPICYYMDTNGNNYGEIDDGGYFTTEIQKITSHGNWGY